MGNAKKNLVSNPKNKLKIERNVNRVIEAADSTTQLNYGVMFILRGFTDKLGDLFTPNKNIFFAGSSILSLISNAAYLIRFIYTPNKNISRVTNLAIRAISLGLFVLLTFGTGVIAPIAITALLAFSAAIFPVVHAIKGFYFLYKKNHGEESHRQFYKDKMVKNFLYMGIGLLIIAGLGVLMTFAGAIAAAILNTIGVVGAALILTIQIWKIVPFFTNLFSPSESKAVIKHEDTYDLSKKGLNLFRKKIKRTASEAPDQNDTLGKGIIRSISHGLMMLSPSKKKAKKSENAEKLGKTVIALPERFNFYQYSVTDGVVNLQAFIHEIRGRKEEVHHPHKKKGLEFLATFMENLQDVSASATKEKPLVIAGKRFHYESKEELTQKIDRYVVRRYSQVYASFFKDVGRTQAYFRAGYHYFLKQPVVSDEVEKAGGKHAKTTLFGSASASKAKPTREILSPGKTGKKIKHPFAFISPSKVSLGKHDQ